MNYLCFWAKKAKHFEFTKNNMTTLKNERFAKIWNPGNVKLQTCNCELSWTEKPDAKGS